MSDWKAITTLVSKCIRPFCSPLLCMMAIMVYEVLHISYIGQTNHLVYDKTGVIETLSRLFLNEAVDKQ